MKKLNIKKVVLAVILCSVVLVSCIVGIRSLFFNNNNNTHAGEEDEASNPFSHLVYYNEDNHDLYIEYQQRHPELSTEDVVTHVNMGIHVPFYTNEPIEIVDPDAIDVLVNKVYKFSDTWEPSNLVDVDNGQKLRTEAANAYQELKEACLNSGFTIMVHSGYRSVAYQREIYDNMVSLHGEDYANQFSSRPGHSEHHTGLAADISINGLDYTNIDESEYYETFAALIEQFGFIIRYQEGKDHLTGFAYEPWHIRYVGPDLARSVNESGLTYDEYVARLGN